MPNTIKYNTSSESNALSIGNMHIGVGDVEKGPTESTGYWNGMNPPNGGYTIYQHKASGGPSILRPTSDAELIVMTNQIAGTSYTTINECFNYFAGQDGKMVMHNPINYLVTDELVLDLNANIIPSYPRSGTSWKDLSGIGNNGTLVNTPDFNSNGTFTLNSGGTGSERIDITKPSQLGTDQYMTIQILFKLNTLPTAQYANNSPILGGQIGNNYMILAYPEVSSKSHLGVSYDDSRYQSGHKSVFETEAGRWVHFTHVAIPYQPGSYQIGKLMYYINGALDRDEFVSGDSNGWAVPSPFQVAYDSRWSAYSDVDVATIKMYNKQLTAEEISANYFQAPIVTDGLIFAADAGNLVSYENGSTTAYSLTGSFSGSLINGVGYNDDNGGAWVFDGTDEGVKFITELDLSGYSSLTYEGWINGAGVTTLDRWFSGTTGASGFHQPDLAIDSNGRLSYYFGILGTAWQQPSIFISTTEYSHVVFTFTNSGDVEIYVNGSSVYTATHNSGTFQTVSNYMIGNRYDRNGEGFVGDIATVRTYNRALTAGEVQQNYKANINKFN